MVMFLTQYQARVIGFDQQYTLIFVFTFLDFSHSWDVCKDEELRQTATKADSLVDVLSRDDAYVSKWKLCAILDLYKLCFDTKTIHI